MDYEELEEKDLKVTIKLILQKPIARLTLSQQKFTNEV